MPGGPVPSGGAGEGGDSGTGIQVEHVVGELAFADEALLVWVSPFGDGRGNQAMCGGGNGFAANLFWV